VFPDVTKLHCEYKNLEGTNYVAFYEGDIAEIPEFVGFLKRMKEWADEFGIYEFVKANDDGEVPIESPILRQKLVL